MRTSASIISFFILFSASILILPTHAVAPTFHKSSNKLGYVFAHVLKPFNNMYDALHRNVLGHVQYLSSTLQAHVSGSSKTKSSDPVEVLVKVIGLPQNKGKQENQGSSEESSSNGRLLASSPALTSGNCQNNGKQVKALVNVYTCKGVVVNEAAYNAVSGALCSVSEENVESCYCSFEYYGDTCENFNFYTCEIGEVNYPGNCTGQNSFDFVYGYSGAPPCYPVSVGQTVTFQTTINCVMSNTNFLYEGVKPDLNTVVSQPNLGQNVFTYAVNAPTFKLQTAPNTLTQQINFIDFNRINFPFSISTLIANNQISNGAIINTPITFDAHLASYATIGRFYYEMALFTNTSSVSSVQISNHYNGGYFENAAYAEPSGSLHLSTAVIAIIAVVGVLLLIAIFLFYKLYQHNNMKKLIDRTHFAPILADQ